MSNIITEDVHLPSEGKIYDVEVNPDVKIKAMTTDQEMRRLSHSERQYKNLCDIIDECIEGDMKISSYDLSLGDYQYILHRLRLATYGSNYKLSSTCPYCFENMEFEIDLDNLGLKEYNEKIEKYMEFELPRSHKKIKLKPQTPHSLDNVSLRIKDFKKKNPKANSDPSLLYTIGSLINTVDGVILNTFEMDNFVRQLPLMDVNYILKASDKISELIGIDPKIEVKCKHCGLDYNSTFRLTDEFFGPSID